MAHAYTPGPGTRLRQKMSSQRQKFILEEIMQESPYYDLILKRGIAQGIEEGIAQGIEEGIAQGIRETSIRNIIDVLTTRFPDADIHHAIPMLEAIGDIERLTELLTAAASTPNFNAFLQALDE